MITFKILDKKPIIENIDDAKEGKQKYITGYTYTLEITIDNKTFTFECSDTIHLGDIEKVAMLYKKTGFDF